MWTHLFLNYRQNGRKSSSFVNKLSSIPFELKLQSKHALKRIFLIFHFSHFANREWKPWKSGKTKLESRARQKIRTERADASFWLSTLKGPRRMDFSKSLPSEKKRGKPWQNDSLKIRKCGRVRKYHQAKTKSELWIRAWITGTPSAANEHDKNDHAAIWPLTSTAMMTSLAHLEIISTNFARFAMGLNGRGM